MRVEKVVLVFELDQETRGFLKLTLENRGLVVLEAFTAEKLLWMISVFHPAVILLDLEMFINGGGLEAIRRIRKRTEATIIGFIRRNGAEERQVPGKPVVFWPEDFARLN